MAKQTINIGSSANDGTGSSLRAGADLINDNFNEIYTALGDGSSISSAAFVTTTGTQTLTNKTLTSPTITGTGAIAGTFTGNITGDVTGDLTGNVTGNVTGDVTGNADTATTLATARTIAGQSFDGSANVTIAATDLSDTDQALAQSSNVQFADLTLTGNLTVNGSTTTVATTNKTIADNLIELNSGAASNTNDTGIIMERGSTGDNAIIAWDESADKFIVGTTTATGSSTGNLTIATGTLVANIEGNITGDVTGNADTATALATGRTIGMTGDVVWTSASFDGSGNVTGTASIQANTISSTELVGATTLLIVDSTGSTVKTIIGAGS
jgi:hypothetical protein